jgi:hypothetical protein
MVLPRALALADAFWTEEPEADFGLFERRAAAWEKRAAGE